MRKYLESHIVWTKDTEIVYLTTHVHFDERMKKDEKGGVYFERPHYVITVESVQKDSDTPIATVKCPDLETVVRKYAVYRKLIQKAKLADLI